MADAQNDQNGFKKFLPGGEKPMAPQARRRMITIAIIAFILGILVINSLFSHQNVKTVTYSTLLHDARSQHGRSRPASTTPTASSRGQLDQRHELHLERTGPGARRRRSTRCNRQRHRHLRQSLEPRRGAPPLSHLDPDLRRLHVLRQPPGPRADERHDVGRPLAGPSSSTRIARRRRSPTSRATSA